MSKKILITGGSGMLGTRLTAMLQAKGYQVAWLGRSGNAPSGVQGYQWDLSKGKIDAEAVEDCHAIIHLAGAGVADKRWTDARKKLIIESRTESARLLFEAVQKAATKPEVFISASAIGYYGMDTGDTWMKETDLPGSDFLSEVVIAWEQAADKFLDLGLRVVKHRIGIVLAKEGGALPKMMAPIKMGVGSPIGSGNQYMSWIHLDDVCGQFLWSVEDQSAQGTYNAVAPHPVTNRALTKALAMQLKKPLWAPNVPSFVLRLMFGEMAGILLGGNRVVAKAVQDAGYSFSYTQLPQALEDLL